MFDFVFLLFHRVDSIILIFPFYSMGWTQLGILYQSSSFERNSIGPAMKYPLIQMTMREMAAMLERPSIPCAALFLVFQGGNEYQIKSNQIVFGNLYIFSEIFVFWMQITLSGSNATVLQSVFCRNSLSRSCIRCTSDKPRKTFFDDGDSERAHFCCCFYSIASVVNVKHGPSVRMYIEDGT